MKELIVMLMLRRVAPVTLALVLGCQTYDFTFQPDTDLQQVDLDFLVQTPSQADILFVVDNSISMTEEQAALIDSFDAFINDLSRSDTAYRIGVVSTDAVGWSSQLEGDCAGDPFPNPLQNGFGGKGNCTLGAVNQLAYPHDGARGRLLAAYDSDVYDTTDPAYASFTEDQRDALRRLFPTGPNTGPCVIDESDATQVGTFYDSPTPCDADHPPRRAQGTEGAEWVIDRELTNLNACNACGCGEGECERGNACFDNCATPVAGAYVRAVFRANIRGLGTAGQGWEQGMRAGLLAIGVEPADPSEELALNPVNDLTDPTRPANEAPNTYTVVDELGNTFRTSWFREDALFAMMFVTDEQDCSMSQAFFDSGKSCFEEGCDLNPANNRPTGSVCYQSIGQANLVAPSQMSRLLLRKKGDVESRVAIGLIGGLTRPDPDNRSVAVADDCVANAPVPAGEVEPTPDTQCRCVTGLPDVRWCDFTDNASAASAPPTCDALGGDRYTEFGDFFPRKTYESVCRADFSQALIDFGNIAKLSCFDLNEISPANGDPSNVRVLRAPRNLAEIGDAPRLLPRTTNGSDEEGWYYVPGEDGAGDQICLNRIDRLIGDRYVISILSTDLVDPRRSIPTEQ